jgi:hypothetical protein
MPAGVLRARSVRNSDEVKPKLGNEDVDFAVLRPKAPNPIIQHPNKPQSHKSQRIGPQAISGKLELWIWDFSWGLQSHRVSGFEPARLTIGGLPAWRPAPGVIVPRRGIESKPGDYGEGVAFACINRYPLATAAFPITAELG